MTDHEQPPAIRAWTLVGAATASLHGAVNERLQAELGISLAENLVLCRVAMSPNSRLSMADIAQAVGVSKSAVTKTVDRLEDRGWLSRQRDTDDRRAIHATLTNAGAAMFRQAQPLFSEAVQQQMAGLSAGELTNLVTLLLHLQASNT